MITVAPDPSYFSFIDPSPSLRSRAGLRMICQNTGDKACPARGDLNILKEWNMGLEGTCFHSEVLTAANSQASLMALTFFMSPQQTRLMQTHSCSDKEPFLVNHDLQLWAALYNLHICQIKRSALQWTGTEGSGFKSQRQRSISLTLFPFTECISCFSLALPPLLVPIHFPSLLFHLSTFHLVPAHFWP